VRDSCEKIQHFGSKKDETGTVDEPDDDVCLQRVDATVKQAKKEFAEVEVVLRNFFKDT
jgi:osomolarity two-component system phosphorelay intermediate protein YPD1